MALASWIWGCVLYCSSFMPLFIQRRVQGWIRRAYHIVNSLDQGELFRRLADVASELHTVSRHFYLSIERSAKKHRRTAILWDRHLKFPLNLAIRRLKGFSEDLLSRAEASRPAGGGGKGIDMQRLVWAITSQRTHRFSRGFRDLSSEIKLLGDFPAAQGVISSIWLGELGNGSQVAVKLLIPHRTDATQKEFIHEAYIWFRASCHENVVPLLGIARLRGSLALVSPWMPERDIGVYMTMHPEANRLELLADVARGLAALHSEGIVYGNLRSSTVMVSSAGRAYLSSFLVAHSLDGDDYVRTNILNWKVVSPEFLTPERRSFPAERKIISTCESDVFMYGMFALEVITMNTPFVLGRGIILRTILQGRLPERPRTLDNLGLTDDFWLLVNHCWHQDPVQRPTMSDVARKMVQLAEACTPVPSDAARRMHSQKLPRDISAEVKKLGEYPIAGGGYCDLYLGERLGAEKVALKLVRLIGSTAQDKDAARRSFINEAQLWAEFQHPRILEFYGICEYGTMSLYMVSPWLENGNIHDYLTNVNPSADRHRLLLETAEGLVYLHSREPPVVHGDLKAANILITAAETAVLADFGLSKVSHEATATLLQGAGSPRWMAPEIILTGSDVTGPVKTLKSDVYAYGHVMLEVLGDKKPFFNLKEDLHVIVELVHGRRSPRPDGPVADKWLDDASWAFSRQCTAPDPEDRPDMNIVLAEMERLRFNRNE